MRRDAKFFSLVSHMSATTRFPNPATSPSRLQPRYHHTSTMFATPHPHNSRLAIVPVVPVSSLPCRSDTSPPCCPHRGAASSTPRHDGPPPSCHLSTGVYSDRIQTIIIYSMFIFIFYLWIEYMYYKVVSHKI